MKRLEICDLCLDEPLSIQAQTQVTGGLLCQSGWGLNDYMGNGFTAGALAGGAVGFYSGGLPGLAVGVGVGGGGGALGGLAVWYLCN